MIILLKRQWYLQNVINTSLGLKPHIIEDYEKLPSVVVDDEKYDSEIATKLSKGYFTRGFFIKKPLL